MLLLVITTLYLMWQTANQYRDLIIRVDRMASLLPSYGYTNIPDDRMPALSEGAAAPNFQLSSVSDGILITLETLTAKGHPVFLVFTDPQCGHCSKLIKKVVRWQKSYSDRLTFAVVTSGTLNENYAISKQLPYVLLQKAKEVAKLYHVDVNPFAVVIHPDENVISAVARGNQQIIALVELTIGNSRKSL